MASARYSLLYRYSTDGMKTWKDFTDIVDSSRTKVVRQLCSTQCKSIVDKASVFMPAQDSTLKRDFIKDILEGNEIYVQIFDLKPSPMLWDDESMIWKDKAMMWSSSLPVFTGVMDRKESTTIKSFPFTPSVSLSLKDLSSLRLDEKVDSYVYLEDRPDDRLTMTKVVRHLLSLAGYEWTADAIEEADERTLPCFVVDRDNAKTYREYIDTLLFEACGYVLDFDRYGRACIVRLPWDDRDSSSARTIDSPLVADGVSTKMDAFENDGTKLTWATLAESSPDQLVYQDSIQRSVDKDTGLLLGVDVPNGGYWPEDGDVQATYQQFSADFLDKPYLIKDSRKRNEDLSIIAVRDVYAYIQATFPNGAKFDSWEYPVLPSLGMESNPTIWPTKAWYLLRNNSGEKVNLQMFTLRGRVMYRAKVNEETVPLSSKKPKEYTSTYIYTQAHARRFSQFWWHYLNTTRYVTTYTEMDSGSLGETVRINHKGVEYGQDAMVISIETMWLNHGTKRVTSTAIGVSAYNEYPSLSTSSVPGRKENGNGTFKVEYKYAVTQTQEPPAPADVTLSDIPTMSETDKYLWRKETTYYTSGKVGVTVNLLAVYGEQGPQGPPGPNGEDGADGMSVSTKAQYLLKAGDGRPTMSDEQEWSDEVPIGWYMGWTYWTRLVTTSTRLDGSIVGIDKTSPMLDVPRNEAMKSSVEFEVSSDMPSYSFDKRTDASVSISVNATTYGFKDDCVMFSWNDGEKTPSPTFTDTIGIAVVQDSASFKCTLYYKARTSDSDWIEYATRTFTMAGKDMTEYGRNFGILENNPSGAVYLDGDFYVKTVSDSDGKTDYLPMMLVNGAWTELSSFSQAPDAVGQMRDLLMSMDAKIPETSVVFYGWFRNIAAQDAVVDNLFARNVRIPGEGSISGGDAGSENFSISGTGKATFKGASLDGCDVSGTLSTKVLRTVNEDVPGDTIGLVDPTNPFDGTNYYDMQDAVVTASRNMVGGDLVSVSGGSVKYRGVVYPKALKRSGPRNYANSASGSISWDTPSKGDSFASKTHRILTLPFQGRVSLDGRSRCSYKTNAKQSVTYYTYGWETSSSSISCDSSGHPNDVKPSNPSVGDTYYTYGPVRDDSYHTWGDWTVVWTEEGSLPYRPSDSTTTSSDGKTQTKTVYTNVIVGTDGRYYYTETIYERHKDVLVERYSQSEYRHEYKRYSNTGVAAGPDVMETAYSRLEYSVDGGATWIGYSKPFDAKTNTVHVRQVFDATPSGTYYTTNPDGHSVSSVPYNPWHGSPTVVDVSSSTGSDNLSDGLYAIDSSGHARTIERTTIRDPLKPIPGNLTSDEFWIRKSDGSYAINIGPDTFGDTFGDGRHFYQRPKSPLFSTSLTTSSFKDLLIVYTEYQSGSQRITTGSIVRITPSSIAVDGAVILSTSYFYEKGSAFSFAVTPLSETKGVHTRSIFPEDGSVYEIGSANRKYKNIYVDNVIGNIGWDNIVGKPNWAFWKTTQYFDLTALDKDKWFPCILNKDFGLPNYENNIILVNAGLGDSGVPSWSQHSRGFSAIMYIMDHGSGWGAIARRPLLLEYNWEFCDVPPVSYSQMERSSIPVIWLRGGGKYYMAMTAQTPYDSAFLPVTDSFTKYEETVSPSTSCPPIMAADIWNVCSKAWLKGNAITGAVFN